MRNFNNKTTSLDVNGKCSDFEEGKNKAYEHMKNE